MQDWRIQGQLDGGFVLDDDPVRIDRAAVHAFITGSYWATGRTRELMDTLIAGAASVGGLNGADGRQLGFARVVSDGHTVSYLADVYVLEEVRGRGLDLELVRFTVNGGSLGETKWILHPRDMQAPLSAPGRRRQSVLGELQGAVSRSSRCSRARAIEIRS